ncbi:MAG: response regulator transcription factor [Bacteroidales bacterium]|nr:response regulator transcription factor [Bacteroidales bacterium]
MIKAIIIDDEKKSRSSLLNNINKFCKNINVIAEAENVKSGVEKIVKYKPELVFLDVQMPDGTGFDLLEKLPEINFKIIFVSAYDQFAVKAFKFSAIDYLLKPVDPDDLVNAVKKMTEVVESKILNEKLKVLLENKNSFEKIALPAFDGIIFVKIKDIIRCESDRNYSVFYLRNKEKILVTRTLKEYDEMLSSLNFYRAHHSHLINLAYVKRYIKGEGGSVIMEDGTEVEVARRRKEGLMSLLLN